MRGSSRTIHEGVAAPSWPGGETLWEKGAHRVVEPMLLPIRGPLVPIRRHGARHAGFV
jgi:hypothetical protein